MEFLFFIVILITAVLVLSQPLWRRILLKSKSADDSQCASESNCQAADCTQCPLPQGGHLHDYIQKTYPKADQPKD